MRLPLFGLALALFASTAVAGARDDLNAFTKGLKGLSGEFSQQVYDPQGKLKERSSGQVALSAPRLFRWEYVKPYPQLIVADGRKVWVHDPDLQQVTVRPQGVEEQNNPLAALIDPARLDAQFVVKELGNAEGLEWLSLAPKQEGDAGFRSARLGFGQGGLVKMHVVDALGQRTDIDFSGWKRNPTFPADTFRYTPPKGVDVIGER
jgi:outer membrane lipoprotein carrier protein